jgi:GNAT superfamily N-acetyltransferase
MRPDEDTPEVRVALEDPRSTEIVALLARHLTFARGQGLAGRMLEHLLAHARAQGFAHASLETGSMEIFAPARALYRQAGFVECPPFGDYLPSDWSIFFTRPL